MINDRKINLWANQEIINQGYPYKSIDYHYTHFVIIFRIRKASK